VPTDIGAGYRPEWMDAKQGLLGRIIYDELWTICGIVRKWPAWAWHGALLLDLTAGPGLVGGKKGSPLVALDAARRLGTRLPLHAYFFERHKPAYQALHEQLVVEQLRDPLPWTGGVGPWMAHLRTVPGDTAQTVAQFLSGQYGWPGPGYIHGLVYADPNGLLPAAALRALAADPRLDRVDFLVRPNCLTYKRVERVRSGGKTTPMLMPDANLEHELQSLGKQYIWLTEPEPRWRFTFFWLSNYQYLARGLRKYFAPLDSAVGQRRLRRALGQAGEPLASVQPGLWGDASA